MSFCDMQKLFFFDDRKIPGYFLKSLTTISISDAPHLLHDSWKYAKIKCTQICMFRDIVKMCTNDNIRLAI